MLYCKRGAGIWITGKGSFVNYAEYKKVIEDVPYTENLEYKLAVFWLHSERLPLKVVSIGKATNGIVKIPGSIVNKAGYRVPIIGISKNAFADNDMITDIVLPSSIQRIPVGAFAGCSALRRIIIPGNIELIHEGTFAGCHNLEDVYYEGRPEDWRNIHIVHQKHEIEFGDLIPGTPVQTIKAERFIHIPGNDALLEANIHFRCEPSSPDRASEKSEPDFSIRTGNKDVTAFFREV